MQSFLLGVPVRVYHTRDHFASLMNQQEIVVGFRTPAGRLTTTQTFKTVQIPRLVRGKPGAWDPQKCFAWGQHFLSQLKAILSAPIEGSNGANETSAHVWRVVLAPGEGATVSLLEEEGVRDVEGGEDRVGFLPRWYYEQVAGKGADRGTPPAAEAEVPPQAAPSIVGPPSQQPPSIKGWNI